MGFNQCSGVDMGCFSPVRFGVQPMFQALGLCQNRCTCAVFGKI